MGSHNWYTGSGSRCLGIPLGICISLYLSLFFFFPPLCWFSLRQVFPYGEKLAISSSKLKSTISETIEESTSFPVVSAKFLISTLICLDLTWTKQRGLGKWYSHEWPGLHHRATFGARGRYSPTRPHGLVVGNSGLLENWILFVTREVRIELGNGDESCPL